jgi:hypothetical protein
MSVPVIAPARHSSDLVPPRRPRRRLRTLLVALATTLVATVLVAPAASASPETQLAELTVRSEANGTTYDRDAFRHWIDADGDGCTTRAEVLKDESSTSTGHTGTCTITSGSWTSAYDGVRFTDAGGMDIDHMVPLKEAWISGASGWSATKREDFANDLGDGRSLIAVSASSNRSKSDQDPDSWMPPSTSYRCTYVSDWIAVKHRWGLAVDSAEKSALREVLAGC